MLNALHVMAMILACWRMTDLFTRDTITLPLRRRFPVYLWTCPRCLSVWAGAVVTALYFVEPRLNWPLALSWLYTWNTEKILARRPRQMVIELSADGRLEMPRSELTSEEIVQAFSTIVSAMSQPKELK